MANKIYDSAANDFFSGTTAANRITWNGTDGTGAGQEEYWLLLLGLASPTFDKTHVTVTNVLAGANNTECTGTNYARQKLTGRLVTPVSGSPTQVRLIANTVIITNAGGAVNFTPYAGVIYRKTSVLTADATHRVVAFLNADDGIDTFGRPTTGANLEFILDPNGFIVFSF